LWQEIAGKLTSMIVQVGYTESDAGLQLIAYLVSWHCMQVASYWKQHSVDAEACCEEGWACKPSDGDWVCLAAAAAVLQRQILIAADLLSLSLTHSQTDKT